MRKLSFSLLAPVFTGRSFRLFVLLEHWIGVVVVSAVAIMSSAGSLPLKAARAYWCQLGQSAASPTPGSGVPSCLCTRPVLCCLADPMPRFNDPGCPGVQWCTCSWLVAEDHSLVPVWVPVTWLSSLVQLLPQGKASVSSIVTSRLF